MNLETRKYNFIQELNTVDEELLSQLEMVLKANKKDWYGDLNAMEQEEIEIGIQQADNKELIEHKDVMATFSKWH